MSVTTGPGAVHLLNGRYDAYMDGAPVVALTGMTFHDLIGRRYQQGIDTTKLMEPVALYNVEVSGPQHAIIVTNRACRRPRRCTSDHRQGCADDEAFGR